MTAPSRLPGLLLPVIGRSRPTLRPTPGQTLLQALHQALRQTLRRAAAALAIAATLSGCATPTPPPLPAAGSATAATVREWAGRFSVTLQPIQPDAAPDSQGGRFELTADGLQLELVLYSPFGQTVASANRRADGSAALRLADGRSLQAQSLDALVQRAVGYPLPVERLPDWLDRRFERVLDRDANGEPADALDSGWRIRLEPRRWQLQRQQPEGLLTLLLLLDR